MTQRASIRQNINWIPVWQYEISLYFCTALTWCHVQAIEISGPMNAQIIIRIRFSMQDSLKFDGKSDHAFSLDASRQFAIFFGFIYDSSVTCAQPIVCIAINWRLSRVSEACDKSQINKMFVSIFYFALIKCTHEESEQLTAQHNYKHVLASL